MRGLMAIAVLAIFGCAPQNEDGAARADGDRPDEARPPPAELPENAIRLHDQYYMIPLAEKVGGCQAYRAYSPTLRVPQVIHYRAADGRFVTNRDEADCD